MWLIFFQKAVRSILLLLYLLATDGNVKTLIYALSCAWNLSGNGLPILLFELKEEAHEYYA